MWPLSSSKPRLQQRGIIKAIIGSVKSTSNSGRSAAIFLTNVFPARRFLHRVLCFRCPSPAQFAPHPNFLFISEGEVVPIEMKIKSKCSVDQVLKYLVGRSKS